MSQTATSQTIEFDAIALLGEALPAVETALQQGRTALRARVSTGARISNAALETEQHAAHCLSWVATYEITPADEILGRASFRQRQLWRDGKPDPANRCR